MFSDQGILPNLIIIGAMKCATTSLHYYLNQHPQISMSKVKELQYFVKERNWFQGVEWYKSYFKGEAAIRGEASPDYANFPYFKDVPERMQMVIPNAKLIYIIRNPIARLLSDYIHFYTRGMETRSLNDALKKNDENNAYLARSRYYMQLKQYLVFYPMKRILILTSEDLYVHRVETLKKIFKFLNVDASFISPKFKHIKHPTNEKRKLNTIGQRLMNFNENHINRYHPGVQRYIARMLCYPFSQRVLIPDLDKNLRRDLEQVLQEDIQKLKTFAGYSFPEWTI